MRIRLAQKAVSWAILGGIAYVLCFPRYDLPILALLVMPLFLYSLHELKSRREAIGLGFLLSAMVSWGGFHWIMYVAQYFGGMPLPAAVGLQLLFCLVAAPQMVIFFVGGYYVRIPIERLPLLLRPVFWSAFYVFAEYLARFVKIFPEHLGNTWIAYPSIAQAASLGGVSLLSFLPLFLGASLFYLRKIGRRAAPSAALAAALIGGFYFWGGLRIQQLNERAVETVKVGFIQPNLEEIEKMAERIGASAAFEQTVTKLVQESEALVSKSKPDFLLWPETTYPISFPTLGESVKNWAAQGYANLVKGTVIRLNTPILFGGYETKNGLDFNAAILLDEKGVVTSTYEKNVLLVFGEYMPLATWLPFLKTLNPQMGDFGRGEGPVPMQFAHDGHSIPIGMNICYEAILPEYMRALALNGARVFVNITKDSWFGDTFEPWQHFQLAALRAIEHGIPMVRSTNTGLSGIVLPTGATHLLSLPFHEAAETVSVPIPLEIRPTLYTLFGEWFAWACLLLALGLGTLALRKKE